MAPVTFELERPTVFRREQVALRVTLLVVLGWIGHPFGLLWIGLPALAAILISAKDGKRYLDENGPAMTGALGWILALTSYLALLTDSTDRSGIRFEVERSGEPTTGSALRRILSAIPSLIVLAILVFVGAFVWVIAAILVLVDERYPEWMWRFLLGIVRRQACLLVYLASLVDRYPEIAAGTAVVSSQP